MYIIPKIINLKLKDLIYQNVLINHTAVNENFMVSIKCLTIFKNHRGKNTQGKMKLYCKINECKK